MTIVAELFEHVVGVDTHARTHTYCLLHAPTGAVIDTATFPTTKAGTARAMSWIVRRTHGSVLAAVEGTSSYGSSATTALVDDGFDVVEVRPAPRSTHAQSVKLQADPGRTHGTGENPFHMDLVDRDGSPRYIALYCERPDPRGGGQSRLSDMWSAIETLDANDREVLQTSAYSYFTDSGVYGVGTHMEQFAILPERLTAGVPVRFTSKMLPHLRRSELVDESLVSPAAATEAFERLAAEVAGGAVGHLLAAGEMLVFDQYRWAHARAPLGPGQEEVHTSFRRLLKQTYVASRSAGIPG